MTRKEEILASYDDVWSDLICESLTLALSGVTDEAAKYQHPIYSDTEQEEDYPPGGTILWHLVHLAHCYRSYTSTIARRPEAPEDTFPSTASSLVEAIVNLKRDREALRKAIAEVPESQLDDKVQGYHSVAHLVRMIVRHDAWHASQIVLVKRMYRMG